jgi:Spy/CpxP family protein refolding chaperone
LVTAAPQSRFNAYVLLVIVFVVGGLTGAGISYAVTEERFVHPPGREHGKRWEKRRENAFARELDLSDDQKRKVGELMREQREARHEAMEAMFEECGDGLREQKEALDAKILQLLNPAQQERFKELASEHGRRFLFERKRGHHGHRESGERGSGRKKKKPKKEH